MDAPASIAGEYAVGTASFGAPLTRDGVPGEVALAVDAADAAGPSEVDACSPILSNVSGRIALAQRGTCPFTQKALNAQNAGAIAIVILNNVLGSVPPGLGGADPAVTIPAVGVTFDTGLALFQQLVAGETVTARIGLDGTAKAGMLNGFVKLYSPNPVEPGSSVSHFDVSTSPNQLMEPAINADLKLTTTLPEDLTRSQLWDVGWFPDWNLDGVEDCSGAEPVGGTLVLGGVDTGIANVRAKNGCAIQTLFDGCSASSVSCIARLATYLQNGGSLSEAEKDLLVRMTAKKKR